MTRTNFYVASKVKHAEVWILLRKTGYRIVSTWIDEAMEGDTENISELAERCILEIQLADVLVLYCEPREMLKGALIEVGAALALGKEVRCVGSTKSLSRVFIQHPLWREFETIKSALDWKETK